MNTQITINNDLLVIGDETLPAAEYRAEGKGSTIIITLASNRKDKVFMTPVANVTLNGSAYGTVAAFCAAFNALVVSTPGSRSLEIVEDNTIYPGTIVSAKITVGAAKAKVADYAKPGYVEIETDADNSGVVYVGGTDVSSSSAAMAADKKRFFELDDLSKLYVLGSEAGQIVYVTGAYKA